MRRAIPNKEKIMLIVSDEPKAGLNKSKNMLPTGGSSMLNVQCVQCKSNHNQLQKKIQAGQFVHF